MRRELVGPSPSHSTICCLRSLWNLFPRPLLQEVFLFTPCSLWFNSFSLLFGEVNLPNISVMTSNDFWCWRFSLYSLISVCPFLCGWIILIYWLMQLSLWHPATWPFLLLPLYSFNWWFLLVHFLLVHFLLVHFLSVHFLLVHFLLVHFLMVHFLLVHFLLVHFNAPFILVAFSLFHLTYLPFTLKSVSNLINSNAGLLFHS